VLILPPLRGLCDGEEAFEVKPRTIREVLLQLQGRFSGVYDWWCEPDDRIRGSVRVIVNGEDVQILGASDTGGLR
jgi:hypothetical protein